MHFKKRFVEHKATIKPKGTVIKRFVEGLIVSVILCSTPPIIIIFVGDFTAFIVLTPVMAFLLISLIIGGLRRVECFDFYDDRIVSRCFFLTTNIIYKSNIRQIIIAKGYSGYGYGQEEIECWFLIDERPKASYSLAFDDERLPLWYNKKDTA